MALFQACLKTPTENHCIGKVDGRVLERSEAKPGIHVLAHIPQYRQATCSEMVAQAQFFLLDFLGAAVHMRIL
jgi:hypothetical protein